MTKAIWGVGVFILLLGGLVARNAFVTCVANGFLFSMVFLYNLGNLQSNNVKAIGIVGLGCVIVAVLLGIRM